MSPLAAPSTPSLLVLQVAMILASFVTVPLLPPASGRMLLIPLDRGSATTLLPRALAGGALVVDRGPVAGSIVVEGLRARIAAAVDTTLILAAPQGGCGARASHR